MKTIVIMDATAKKADLEKKMLERKILEELEKKRIEKIIQEKFESEIARAAKIIEESESHTFELHYSMKEIHNFNDEKIIREVVARISIFLEGLGYVVNEFHEYSRNWQKKCGEFGYLFFRLP